VRYELEEMEEAYAEISKNQKPKGAIFGALVGAVPALLLYYVFALIGGHFILLLALPPALIGLFSRLVGRTFRHKHRLPVGVIGALVHIIGCALLSSSLLLYLLAPLAFYISMTVAKIRLKEVHEWAIYQADLGKLNINKATNKN
jgi:LytS/YehU family sensor histidine kinase